MTPDMMTDNLARAQDRIKLLKVACEKVLPLIEAAGLRVGTANISFRTTTLRPARMQIG